MDPFHNPECRQSWDLDTISQIKLSWNKILKVYLLNIKIPLFNEKHLWKEKIATVISSISWKDNPHTC